MASEAARKRTEAELRAATSKPCEKLHLFQTGKYQLQDAFLSEPFHVNASFVLNAYTCFARQTGCRPGMAVNDVADAADAAGHWFELPPLQMDSLSISADALLGDEDGVLTEGGYLARCRMEVVFKRKKGEYFACYDFGTAITPDSDQMVRIGVVALIRLQLRTASYRACYAKLDSQAAAALRAKVADPTGFAGIDFEETGYGGFAELVAACRADCLVRDKAAFDRPLFPGVHAGCMSRLAFFCSRRRSRCLGCARS